MSDFDLNTPFAMTLDSSGNSVPNYSSMDTRKTPYDDQLAAYNAAISSILQGSRRTPTAPLMPSPIQPRSNTGMGGTPSASQALASGTQHFNTFGRIDARAPQAVVQGGLQTPSMATGASDLTPDSQWSTLFRNTTVTGGTYAGIKGFPATPASKLPGASASVAPAVPGVVTQRQQTRAQATGDWATGLYKQFGESNVLAGFAGDASVLAPQYNGFASINYHTPIGVTGQPMTTGMERADKALRGSIMANPAMTAADAALRFNLTTPGVSASSLLNPDGASTTPPTTQLTPSVAKRRL